MSQIMVSVHQPNFMPWLKLLDKILASDVYVAYDTTQYTRSEYHARQRVKTHDGPAWLSVALRHRKGARQLIKDVLLDNSQPFRQRHVKVLRNAYRSTPYFDEVLSIVEKVYARDHDRLVDLNLDLIEAFCDYLDAPVRIVRASTLPHHGDKAQRLIDLVRAVGGTAHLTSSYGVGHQEMDWSPFVGSDLTLWHQEFTHPRYEQIGRDFVPHLAGIDLLFSRGRRSAEILAEHRRLVRVEAVNGEVPERVA